MVYEISNRTMEKLINLAWITGGSLNLLQWIQLIHFNEVVTIASGIGAVVLIVMQIIKYAGQIRQQSIQRKDMQLHIKKEEMELRKMREDEKSRKIKSNFKDKK